MIKLAMEQATWVDNSEYGKVHKAGCLDLRDGVEFECAPTMAAMQAAAEDESGWEGHEFELSPCARKLVKG